jgi:hypothetical protein
MLGYDPDEDPLTSPQLRLPGFYFDSSAKQRTIETLLDDIPSYLFENTESIQFADLFSAISNGTPATSQHLREALRRLAREGTLTIRDASGQTHRRSGVQRDSDVIVLARNRTLFLPYGCRDGARP